MGMPAIRRHWTTADVRALMDESRPWPRYELIDGELLVTPSPGWRHQFAVTECVVLLAAYLERERVGVVLVSPADLELRPGTITQPDVFVLPEGAREAVGYGSWTWSDIRSLLLAIEVISPSTIRTDRVTKREYYLDVGVPDYFIVDVDARIVERWSPERDTPLVLRDQLVWHPAGAEQPLTVSLPEFFDRIIEKLRFIGMRER
jgi:Uma2 family endonuclease